MSAWAEREPYARVLANDIQKVADYQRGYNSCRNFATMVAHSWSLAGSSIDCYANIALDFKDDDFDFHFTKS